MELNKNLKIKIKGGKMAYGDVNLEGDSINSMAMIVRVLMEGNDLKLTNVPRTPILLKFIDLLRNFSVEVSWLSIDTIKVHSKKTIISDISFLSDEDDLNFVKILIPLVLKKRGLCRVSKSLKGECLYYKSIGFGVKTLKESIEISSTGNKAILKLPIDFSAAESGYDVSARFLLLNLFDKKLSELNYNLENLTTHISANWYSNLLIESNNSKEDSYRVRSNKNEFALCALISVLTRGEVIINNYDLSLMLPYLLLLEKFGGRYLVTQSDLKIWCESKLLDPYYDFSFLDSDLIEYAIVLAVINTRYLNTNTEVTVNYTSKLSLFIKNLNIIGFDLVSNKIGKNLIINIKPSKMPVKVKLPVHDLSSFVPLLGIASILEGSHLFTDVSYPLAHYPSIIEILKELKVDASVN